MDFTTENNGRANASIVSSHFGPLLKYLDQPNITDIDFNGQTLWIRDIYNVRKSVVEPIITEEWINALASRIADATGSPFNMANPVLEAETENLRITCTHSSISINGVAMCIRKTSKQPRITYESALKDRYADRNILNLIISCVKAKMNIIICGEPGVGKTEFAKFLCGYISPSEKVVTIEDTPEWHYKDNNPGSDCIELRTSEVFSYTKALKTCMRLNPNRIMLSEVRSIEAASLIECWSTGVKGITTLHSDDIRKIPDRLLNMMHSTDADRLENNVYSSLDVGVLLRSKLYLDEHDHQEKRYRYVDQLGFFDRVGQSNQHTYIVKNGQLVIDSDTSMPVKFPNSKISKFNLAGINSPFADPK